MKRSVAFVIIALVLTSSFAQEMSLFAVEGVELYELVSGRRERIATLATNDDFFFGFGPTYTVGPSGEIVAFIGEDKHGYALFIYRVGMKSPQLVYGASGIAGESVISGWSEPEFSPSEYSLVFSMIDGIYRYDIDSSFLGRVTDTEDYMDTNPFFSADEQFIYFYRGNTFEYVFSAHLYRVASDGTGLVVIPEVRRKYPPEWLGGQESAEEGDPYRTLVFRDVPGELDKMLSDIFPIGFSPDGHFAYLRRGALDLNCQTCPRSIEAMVQNLVTDKIAWRIEEHADSVEQFWEENGSGIIASIDRFGIETGTELFFVQQNRMWYEGALYEFPIETGVRSVSVGVVESDYRLGLDALVVLAISEKLGWKQIYSDPTSSRSGTAVVDAQVVGVFVSPFGSRAAVIYAYQTGGQADVVDFTIIGSHLAFGYQVGRPPRLSGRLLVGRAHAEALARALGP